MSCTLNISEFFRSCDLYNFLQRHVSNVYLKRKCDEILEQIEAAVRAADAWKTTVLLDLSSDYKPLLVVSSFIHSVGPIGISWFHSVFLPSTMEVLSARTSIH